MSAIARYGKAVTHPGQGGELASILLAAADGMAGLPGCELYLVSQQKGEPDASVAQIQGSDSVARAMSLVQSWEMIELDLLGGKGDRAAVPVAVLRLDHEARLGQEAVEFGHVQEAQPGPVGPQHGSVRRGRRLGERHHIALHRLDLVPDLQLPSGLVAHPGHDDQALERVAGHRGQVELARP